MRAEGDGGGWEQRQKGRAVAKKKRTTQPSTENAVGLAGAPFHKMGEGEKMRASKQGK